MSDLEELAARAHAKSVIVVGGGIAGLVAAWECAKVGMRVTLVERAPVFGGALRAHELGDLVVDVGAESFATRGGTVRALIETLGLGDAVIAPEPRGAWVAGLPGGRSAPMPRGGMLGIPANPWAPDVRRVIGWSGAWRAYVDRLRPPLTIGHRHSLGQLVRSRMGEKVLDRLVAPVTSGVYSARPDDIDVDLAAPGLNAALTRTGSLSGAVADLRGGRRTAPGGAVEGLVGGIWRLAAALTDALVALGADLRPATSVLALRSDGGGWTVVTDAPDEDAELQADAVIVAIDEHAARDILAPVVDGLDALDGELPPTPVVEVVTLVVDAPALDAAPRGSGVLTVPHTRAAKALTHATAKWGWLAEAAGPGRHVIRVSFGAQGEAPATRGLSDAEAFALALAEASALLGVPLPERALQHASRHAWLQAQPAASIGRADRVAAARTAIAAVPGLGVTGAWASGTGLAQVVPDAQSEADRVRAALLWGDQPPA